jgi:hypothetical protein
MSRRYKVLRSAQDDKKSPQTHPASRTFAALVLGLISFNQRTVFHSGIGRVKIKRESGATPEQTRYCEFPGPESGRSQWPHFMPIGSLKKAEKGGAHPKQVRRPAGRRVMLPSRFGAGIGGAVPLRLGVAGVARVDG